MGFILFIMAAMIVVFFLSSLSAFFFSGWQKFYFYIILPVGYGLYVFFGWSCVIILVKECKACGESFSWKNAGSGRASVVVGTGVFFLCFGWYLLDAVLIPGFGLAENGICVIVESLNRQLAMIAGTPGFAINVLFGFFLTILVPVTEEFYFRGFCQNGIFEVINSVALVIMFLALAVFIRHIALFTIFAPMQVYFVLLFGFALFVLFVILGVFYSRNRSLHAQQSIRH